LGILADQRATAPLVAQAAKESDEDVRAACYHALADLGNAKGEQELLAALEKSDPLTLDHAAQNGSPAAKRLARQVLEARNASPRI
jgi:HEAT repeat protein